MKPSYVRFFFCELLPSKKFHQVVSYRNIFYGSFLMKLFNKAEHLIHKWLYHEDDHQQMNTFFIVM